MAVASDLHRNFLIPEKYRQAVFPTTPEGDELRYSFVYEYSTISVEICQLLY